MIYKYILLINLLLAATLYGDVTDSLKVRHYSLEALRVIGERPSETIGSVSTTNIDDKTDALNIKDAMTDLPGISMTVGTKDESNLRIRGFRKNEVKILIDGRPLNAGYFGNVNLQNLPVSDITEIQVLKGPVSSMYGSNTLGGVVNLITRDPSARKWFKVGMFVKRNNTNHIELSTSHQFESWNYWLFASREHTDGFLLSREFEPTTSENGGVRDNSSKTQQHLEGKSTFNLTDFHTITITAGVTSIPKKYLPSSIYETTYRMYVDWLRMESTLRSNLQLSPDINLESMLYYDGGKDTYREFNDPFFHHMAMDSDMKNFTVGFNPKLNWQVLNGSKLTMGYRGEEQYSNRKDNGNYPNWTDHSTLLHNLFSQMDWKVATDLSITGSAGVSYFEKDIDEEHSVIFEPSLGIYYNLPNQASISAAVGRNTAFPTMRQLFSVENGNINLRPQIGTKYEITGSQPLLFSNMKSLINMSIYLNYVRDLIDIYGDNIYQNIYKVRSYGGEAEFDITPLKWLEMVYSYAYLDYTSYGSYRLTESPKNSMETDWTFSLPSKLTFTLTSQWKDSRYGEDSGLNYHAMDSYWVANLMIRKEWRGYKASVGIDNFTDTNYQEEYGFPAPGINFSIGLEKEF